MADSLLASQMFMLISFVFVASGVAHSLEALRPGSFIRPFTDDCQWDRYRYYAVNLPQTKPCTADSMQPPLLACLLAETT